MGDGEIRGYGLFGKVKYNTLKPRYDVSKEQLVRIVEGNVKTLTFYMQGEPFEISVLGNRFSLVAGEECAGLRPVARGLVMSSCAVLFSAGTIRTLLG